MESETSLPNLLCDEDESSLNDDKDENFEFCSISESDSEFIEMLFQKETNFRPENDEKSIGWRKSWLKSARSKVIKWILKKRALFGYHYRTAYLSVIYFDRYLTRTRISDGNMWQIRILSVACLSLAAKMEERVVRALSEYSVKGCQFGGSLIQRMELIVLNKLEWKMIAVTPFTFLNYFASKFCQESKCRRKEVNIQAAELILAITKEINLAESRPSIVAAAAILAAYDYHLTKTALENKMYAVPLWGSLEKEHAFSCYSQLHEILMLKTPKSDISANLLSSDVDDFATTSRGTIRKLNFDEHCDQHSPSRKTSRSQ